MEFSGDMHVYATIEKTGQDASWEIEVTTCTFIYHEDGVSLTQNWVFVSISDT